MVKGKEVDKNKDSVSTQDQTPIPTQSQESEPVGNDAIDAQIANALKALEKFMFMTQEQVDAVVKAMAMAGLSRHMELAHAAVRETGRGIFEDKVTKNIFATEYIYHSIKYEKTVGVVDSNEYEDYVDVAEPVGVIAAVTPVTNPTSTTMFKAIIAMKTRNPIIFAFHPGAQSSSSQAARVMLEAALQAGAPPDCIQWVEEPSVDATRFLMNHKDIALVLATGGSGMVRAAYSTGKPALGVGPGNVPCYIEKTADIPQACTDLMLSKTFDNGMICASEQAVIVDRAVADTVEEYLRENACHFLSSEEIAKVEKTAISPDLDAISPDIVGKSAYEIAVRSGIDVEENTKILVAPLEGVGPAYPLSREKLSPILAYYVADSTEEGLKRAEEMVQFGGMGHSAVIHSRDNAVIEAFSRRMKTGRIIVNSPSSQGAIGDIYNTNMPSLTLGCGSYGQNSTTSNVTAVNLINKKKVAKRRVNMQWFKIPEKIFFEYDSAQYLSKMPEISRAFIVTDAVMADLGYVKKILYYLRKRRQYVHSEVFTDVEPDPSIETVMRGVAAMNIYKPDVIIALGGGSVIDAAKAMWLFYENPELDFAALTLKFMDIRKRIYKYPFLGKKAKMVAIPTTSGTGSEVTSFAVITDQRTGTKYPLADYELTPDVAIIDPEFVMSVPPRVTADTGIDVLTHAIEAYVSVMASDYTDALAVKAAQMVFEYLPLAYHDGGDRLAREKMHNASTIAGMAFTNAFLGLNHAMAHKLGAEFGLPHGRANAILLPHVIAYNAQKPTKFTIFPKYSSFRADERYGEIARGLGLPAASSAEGVASLIAAVRGLMFRVEMPSNLADCGIERHTYMEKIPALAEKAFEDQTITSNPRLPLLSEIEEIYREAF
ncbi:MAG: bifunctional acetaldehyde-CoA/alcohol dehydrogenase [Gracilibacteraceae bacterium]|jgi:acetaldehyde dehydrogenase/alcohol dehydrogenase|nr:bifunctional acetaldehyde-CoA/alcohol dehydrogenase [Gracilibacteraceae bacterium]